MAKPRKRKSTTRQQATGKRPAKRPASKRRAAPPSDDLEIFIPKVSRRLGDRCVDQRKMANASIPDDEITVFVARPGRPVEVQADLVEDLEKANTPDGISSDEYFDAIGAQRPYAGTPRANTPAGWTPAELGRHGFLIERGRTVCRYRCDGLVSNIPNVSAHHYTCPFWDREGKTQSPF